MRQGWRARRERRSIKHVMWPSDVKGDTQSLNRERLRGWDHPAVIEIDEKELEQVKERKGVGQLDPRHWTGERNMHETSSMSRGAEILGGRRETERS